MKPRDGLKEKDGSGKKPSKNSRVKNILWMKGRKERP
jgi:hypothetical protein